MVGRHHISFPKTVNIQVERSVVRLFVPDSYEWFGFTGTLGTPVNEVEVQKTAQEYLKSQLIISKAALDSGDAYDIARARNNLKQVELEFQELQQGQRFDAELSTLNAFNGKALQEQIEQGNRSQQEDFTNATGDNRERFGRLFQDQRLSRAKNVVGNESRNFYNSPQKPKSAEYGLNPSWFESNKLESKGKKPDTGKSMSRYQSNDQDQQAPEGKESEQR